MRPRRILAIILLALIAIYAGDWLGARLGLFHGGTYGAVRVKKTLAVLQKNEKNEFYFLPTEDVPCVNSMFPHFGVQPCWYLMRHPVQQVQM